MNDLTIRELSPDDLTAVAGLLRELAEHAHAALDASLDHLEEVLRAMLRQPESYTNLVAVSDGAVIGLLSMVSYKSFYHRTGTALINELVVTERARGLGVGRALVARAVAAARAADMDEIEVGTERSNQSAQAFYKRSGFDQEYVLLGMEFSDSAPE